MSQNNHSPSQIERHILPVMGWIGGSPLTETYPNCDTAGGLRLIDGKAYCPECGDG